MKPQPFNGGYIPEHAEKTKKTKQNCLEKTDEKKTEGEQLSQ